MYPNPGYPGPTYYPDGDISRRNSGSFNRRGARTPRVVDPHSFARYHEPQPRPHPSYTQRGGHRSSFSSNRGRRPSFRSGDAWQGPRDTRPFDRRVQSDHRAGGFAQNRETRSYSGESTENRSHSDTGFALEPDEQGYTQPVLPSLSEDGSIDEEVGKQQDSSPKTIEDDSFQTAAENPTATPTENELCEKPQSAPHSPASLTESDGIAPIDTNLSEALTKEKLPDTKAESVPYSPTTSTTESADTASIQAAGQQPAVSKSGPKQTESFSPFARRANPKKKEPKQKPGKSKIKPKPEPSKQPMVDTPMSAEAIFEEHIESNDETVVGPASHVAEGCTEESEDNESHKSKVNVEDHRTELSAPQTRSTLSSFSGLFTGALNMGSSNKSKSGDDPGSALSQPEPEPSQPETSQPETSQPEASQTEVVPSTSKNKSKNKNKKKKKKAKAAAKALDDTSTETIANETPVGSPPSTNMPLRQNTNMLDNRLSILNIKEGSIVELHENMINYHNSHPVQQENFSFYQGREDMVEQSRRKLDEMTVKEKLLKQKK
jgi:hypothetical protein